MSTKTASSGQTDNCQRCVEGLVQVNVISNGDGSFIYDVNCNDLISNLDPSATEGEKSTGISVGAQNAICQDIGSHAASSAGPWLWAPQIGPVGPPPPQGTTYCLEFGVDQCYQLETDGNGNTSITGRTYNSREAFGPASTC